MTIGVKSHNVQEVLAVAFAAYRKNSGYEKYSTGYRDDPKAVTANKDLVKMHFREDPGVENHLTVLPEDYESANDALKYFRRYTLGVLGENLNGFQADIYKYVTQDTIPSNRIGLLAYVPELVKKETAESAYKKLLRTEYRDSQHIKHVGEQVEGVVKILSVFYSKQWERYNCVADLAGNLVSFMTTTKLAVDDMKQLRARVKDHTKNRSFDVNETRLNYVKLKDL